MNLYLISYVVVCFMIGIGGSYQLYRVGNLYSAILFLIGTIIISVYYGLRWFGSSPLFTTSPVNWPPVINKCPDYLTYYQRDVNGVKTDTCIDLLGVTRGNTLRMFPKNGAKPATDDYYLNLSSIKPATAATDKCNVALNKFVTWEGITNGESCVTSGSGK